MEEVYSYLQYKEVVCIRKLISLNYILILFLVSFASICTSIEVVGGGIELYLSFNRVISIKELSVVCFRENALFYN